jgi:hypothetical protein
MALQKYNPKKVIGSWKPIVRLRPLVVPFNGAFMADTFINAKYADDRVTEHVGADGTVTIVLNASELAMVTLTLSQGAPANTLLSRLYGSAKRNLMPVGVFNFEDLNSNTLIKSPQAWIKTTAEIEFGKDVKARQWVFGLSEAELMIGESGEF